MAGKEWYEPEHPAGAAAEVKIDTTVPHIACIYDYWLGGKDNFAVDRAAAQRAMDANPALYQGVRGNRAFLARSVRSPTPGTPARSSPPRRRPWT